MDSFDDFGPRLPWVDLDIVMARSDLLSDSFMWENA